jgi:hypothetical protein
VVQDILDHPWMAKADEEKSARFESQIQDQAIDVPLIQELTAQFGIDWQQLKSALIGRRYDSITALYRIARRPRALAAYRQPREGEALTQTFSFMVAGPVELPRGLLEKERWKGRVRKDIVRCNSNTQSHGGPRVLQPSVKRASGDFSALIPELGVG